MASISFQPVSVAGAPLTDLGFVADSNTSALVTIEPSDGSPSLSFAVSYSNQIPITI